MFQMATHDDFWTDSLKRDFPEVVEVRGADDDGFPSRSLHVIMRDSPDPSDDERFLRDATKVRDAIRERNDYSKASVFPNVVGESELADLLETETEE